jgi:malonyl-CoA O-methyltransferase
MMVSAMEGHPLLALEQRTMEPWLPALGGSRFVDVGCGTGRWAALAQRRGAVAVGLDFCEPMLRAGALGPHYAQADAQQLPVQTAAADVTVCAFSAGYLPSPRRLLCELSRVSRPGGLVLISDVHPEAIAAGWTRSFRHNGEVCEIENQPHAIAAYLAAARDERLTLLRSAEPAMGEPEREIFRQCGREHRFESARRRKAIFALLWRRL